MDYVTGCIKGIYTKQLSSEIGFKGLLKKIVMFIVIAVAYVIQGLVGGKNSVERSGDYVLHRQRRIKSIGKCSGVCTGPGETEIGLAAA